MKSRKSGNRKSNELVLGADHLEYINGSSKQLELEVVRPVIILTPKELFNGQRSFMKHICKSI